MKICYPFTLIALLAICFGNTASAWAHSTTEPDSATSSTTTVLSLEACQQAAQRNYPLVAQFDLIDRSEQYDLKNAGRGYLPQLSLSAKATYQSDITQIALSLPGVEIPSLSKDQYQAVLEVDQVIWDGGSIRAQQRSASAKAEVNRSQQRVDMYALRERINSLFFGILLLDEQLRLNALYDEELTRNLRKVESCIANGVANRADLNLVRVEQLSNRQRRTELETTRSAYRRMLGAFIGTPLGTLSLEKPSSLQELLSAEIRRPELELFDARKQQLDAQAQTIGTKSLPRLSAFVQGAYGRPGLNLFSTNFKPYALGGLRLTWNFGAYYTKRGEMHLIDLSRNSVETQQATFLFNTHQQIDQQNGELEKYRRTLEDDREIVALREEIRRASESRMSEGTMSVTDYMNDVTAAERARQNLALHEVQWMMSYYNLKNLTNN